jgi:hypothetical protein
MLRIDVVVIEIALFLAACSSSPPVPEGWTSLFDGETLKGWEITRFGGEGRVRVQDGVILLPWGETLTGITYQLDFPRFNYEIMLEAKRVQGTDFFCGLTFPVQDSHCTLIVGGWGGTVIGLSSLDGLDASENETGLGKRLVENRWYRIRVRVTQDRIEAWLDEEQVVGVATKGRDVGIRPEVSLSRPLGVAAWQTTAALRNIYFRPIAR